MAISAEALARKRAKWKSKCRGLIVNVNLDPDDMRAIRAKAQREGWTIAEIVRTYVAWGIETEEAA